MPTSTLPKLPETSSHANPWQPPSDVDIPVPRELWKGSDTESPSESSEPGKRSEAIAIPVLPEQACGLFPATPIDPGPLKVTSLAKFGSAFDAPEIDVECPTEVIDRLPLQVFTLPGPPPLPTTAEPYRTGSAIAPQPETRVQASKGGARSGHAGEPIARQVPEARIQADLSRAADFLLHMFGKRLDGICLVGSFGRGEETLRFIDGAWEPDDDYDLLLIFSRETNPDELPQRIARDALPRLNDSGLVQFDIKWLHPATTARIGNLTRYDLTRVYKYISGDSHRLAKLVKGRDIALDRDAGLDRVLYRTARFFHAYADAVDMSFGETAGCIAAQHALHQVVLAVGDSMLIDAGAYTPKLSRRQQRMQCHRDDSVPGQDWWHRRFMTVAQARLQGYRGIPERGRLEEGFLQIALPLSDYLIHAVSHLDAPEVEYIRRSTSTRKRRSSTISRATNRITTKLGITRDLRAERVDLAHRMARILRACRSREHMQHIGPTARALYESWYRLDVTP